jgi:hypothetical protein
MPEENSDRLGGRWCDRTSSSSTLPRSVQAKSCNGSWQKIWQFSQLGDSNPPTPHEISKWGSLTSQTNSNIYQFTGNMTGKRQHVAPRTKTQLHTVSSCCTLQLLSLNWRRRPTDINNNTWTSLTLDLLLHLTSLNMKCFCFWWLLFGWNMKYVTAWRTTDSSHS